MNKVSPYSQAPESSECPGLALLHFMDILSTRDTYRLALKGSLIVSPLVLTDYRFSLTVLLLLRLRISAEGDKTQCHWMLASSKYFNNAIIGVLQKLLHCSPLFDKVFRQPHFTFITGKSTHCTVQL